MMPMEAQCQSELDPGKTGNARSALTLSPKCLLTLPLKGWKPDMYAYRAKGGTG